MKSSALALLIISFAYGVQGDEITRVPRAAETENPYSTLPTVVKTATINGFADKIYDDLPECAKACVVQDVGRCPYWDTGCLCVMGTFANPVANCFADECKGQDVVSVTSLAFSLCSSAGATWNLPATIAERLDVAATVEPEITNVPDSSSTNNPYSTFPSVVKTATINGFADKIYDDLPECAKPCMTQDVGRCPYWDTGCLCVMGTFANPLADCVADECKGKDVVTATSLAYSVCSAAGVWEPYWIIPTSIIERLDAAATEEVEEVITTEITIITTESNEGHKEISASSAEPAETSVNSIFLEETGATTENPEETGATSNGPEETGATSENPKEINTSTEESEDTDTSTKEPEDRSASSETHEEGVTTEQSTEQVETKEPTWNSTSTKTIFKTTTNVIEDCQTSLPCIISIIISCEEEIKSLKSIQSSASKAQNSEIISSCVDAKSSLSSVKSVAQETIKYLTTAPGVNTPDIPVADSANGKNIGFTAILGVFIFATFAVVV